MSSKRIIQSQNLSNKLQSHRNIALINIIRDVSGQLKFQYSLLLQAICQMLNQFILPSFSNKPPSVSLCYPNSTCPSKMSENHIFIDLVSPQETGSEVAVNQLSQHISRVDKEECSPFLFDLSQPQNQKKAGWPNQKKIRKRCKGAQNEKKQTKKKSRKLKTCLIGLKLSKSQVEESVKRQRQLRSQITYPGPNLVISILNDSQELDSMHEYSASPDKSATNFSQTKEAKLSQGGLVKERQQFYKNQINQKNTSYPVEQRVTRNRAKINNYSELNITNSEQDEDVRTRYQVAKYRYRLTSTAFAIDQLASTCTEKLQLIPNRANVAHEPTIPLSSSKYSILIACLRLQLRKRKFIDIVE